MVTQVSLIPVYPYLNIVNTTKNDYATCTVTQSNNAFKKNNNSKKLQQNLSPISKKYFRPNLGFSALRADEVFSGAEMVRVTPNIL
jgi:hypothetical protein